MEDIKKELINALKEVKKDLEDDSLDEIRHKVANNLVTTHIIVKDIKDGKNIVEAVSEMIRSYDDALAKCLEAGAKADDEFMYDFTVHYLNTILSLVANLFLVEDFAKDKDNLAFLKSKVRECLIYIDRL